MTRWGPSAAALPVIAALALWLVPAHGSAEEPTRWTNVSRVVVVGDVHGAYEALVELLEDTGLVGPDLHWTGGSTHLVSLGDLLDRGAAVRPVLELVMRLQAEAAAAGGRVHVLLGNHEVMNLVGDLRYVAPGDYAAFAADENPALREAAYAEFAAAVGSDSDGTRMQFDTAYPRGFFARQAAFAQNGTYGAWLLSLPTLLVIDDTVYVHAGLPPIVAEVGLDLNAKVRADVARYLELRASLAARGALLTFDPRDDGAAARAALASAAPPLAEDLGELIGLADATELGAAGPHWYRGSVYCKPLLEQPTLEAALGRLGVSRVIVGHTPTIDHRVRALYDGRLVMADTGMLTEYFGGRPAALVIEGASVEVRYVRPPQRSGVETAGRLVAYERTDADLRAALAHDAITLVDRGDGTAPWHVVLGEGDAALSARFIPRRAERSGDFELAAAALDDLLGTALVPPTVPRTIEGQAGALQLRHPDAITEADRLTRGLAFGEWCPIEPQAALMRAFDLLIGNRARTTANVAFTNALTDLTLTEHGLAFGTERTLPPGIDPAALEWPMPLVAALRSLDEPSLREALGAWLDSRRIRALLARRDRLVPE